MPTLSLHIAAKPAADEPAGPVALLRDHQPMPGFRDPRFAARRLQVETHADGSLILRNPTPVVGVFETLIEPLAHWADVSPNRGWLAERAGAGWRVLSYGEGLEAVSRLAGGLREQGITGSGPLLILAHNGIDHALITYAATSQGMPVAPVSPQYGLPGAQLGRLAHAVAVLRPTAVYTEDADLFHEALDAAFLSGLPVIASRRARPHDIVLADLMRARPAPDIARPETPAKYLLTSGSTGLPKAVILTHRNIATNAAQLACCVADPEPPVTVNCAPWSHSLGANTILHGTTHRGGTLYIDRGQPVAGRFGETLRNLREISSTHHHMVPAGWMLLAAELERDEDLARTFFARVRLLQYGGANLPQAFCDRIQGVALRTVGEKISFASGYGATETGPTVSNVHWVSERMGLMGLPIPGTSVKLASQAGKLELRVKGPQVTCGYLDEPERSAAAFDEDGYYRLGDAARLADPTDPLLGLVYDGRLSENFKLATGAFVNVGELRIAALGAVGDTVSDAVVCGEGRDQVGLLFYPAAGRSRGEIEAAVKEGLTQMNQGGKAVGSRIGRALVLEDRPDPNAGEITDKGYIAQALARTLRADQVARLFAVRPASDVMVF